MTLDMDSRNTAEQVDSQDSEQVTSSLAEKLKTAYINARDQLELTEVELNRSKIMMIDEDGNLRKVPILSEHQVLSRFTKGVRS
ncbi:hypothetical protein P4S64_15615 [Vibrio sp. M60_M31a]